MAHHLQSWNVDTDSPVPIVNEHDKRETRKNGGTRGRFNSRPTPFSRNLSSRHEDEKENTQGASLLGSPNGSIAIHDGEFNATAGSRISVTINAGENATRPKRNPRKRKKKLPGDGTAAQGVHQGSTTDGSQNNMPPRTSFETYYLNLSTKGRGSPLWIPGPNRRLPAEYQKTGVRIGDVGIITSQGSFDFLFNIFSPRDHPINSNGVPEGFVPLSLGEVELREHAAYPEDSYMSSDSIKRIPPNNNIPELAFESTASEGAVLTMPVGSNSEDVGNMIRLRLYAKNHAERWYKHVILDRGREVKNGDVRLVTGYDKTSAWGMAAFSNFQEPHDPLHLRFMASEKNTYKWECSGTAEVRAGPGAKEVETLRANSSDPEGKQYENQCLFIRTLNITFQKDVWQQLKIECDYIDGDEDENNSDSSSFSSQGNSPHGRPFFSSGSFNISAPGGSYPNNFFGHTYGTFTRSSSRLPHISIPCGTLSTHPAAVLNDLLLSVYPLSRMAITEDSDWMSVMKDDRILPSADEIRARIFDSFNFSETEGMAILVKPVNGCNKSSPCSNGIPIIPPKDLQPELHKKRNMIQVPSQPNPPSSFSEQMVSFLDPYTYEPPYTRKSLPYGSYADLGYQYPESLEYSPSLSQTCIYDSHMQFGTTGILEDYSSASSSVFLPNPCPRLRPPHPPPLQPMLGLMDSQVSSTHMLDVLPLHPAFMQPRSHLSARRKRKRSTEEFSSNSKSALHNFTSDEDLERADYTSPGSPQETQLRRLIHPGTTSDSTAQNRQTLHLDESYFLSSTTLAVDNAPGLQTRLYLSAIDYHVNSVAERRETGGSQNETTQVSSVTTDETSCAWCQSS